MDWTALIIKYLDPILAKCLSQFSSETPQEYLRANYNAESNTMDPSVVRDAIPATMKAIRKARRALHPRNRRDFPVYSREDVRAMTEKRLIDAMDASEAQVSAVQTAAATLVDDDE